MLKLYPHSSLSLLKKQVLSFSARGKYNGPSLKPEVTSHWYKGKDIGDDISLTSLLARNKVLSYRNPSAHFSNTNRHLHFR
jgi:hypothetical protein